VRKCDRRGLAAKCCFHSSRGEFGDAGGEMCSDALKLAGDAKRRGDP